MISSLRFAIARQIRDVEPHFRYGAAVFCVTEIPAAAPAVSFEHVPT